MAFFHSPQKPTVKMYTGEFVLGHNKKNLLQDQILQTLKMLPEIDEKNFAAFSTVHMCPLRS